MRKNLIIELFVIGIFAIILEFFIYRLITGEFPGYHLKHFNSMLLGSFLLGSSMHLILEIVGANEKWCVAEFATVKS